MTGYSRFASTFLAAFLAAGVANAAPALSPALQKQAIAMRVVACLSQEAARHDNGVADANTIAARIAPLCSKAFRVEEIAFGAGLSPKGEREYRALMAKNRVTLAAEVVKRNREARMRMHRV